MERGLLAVISGFAGAGKGTIVSQILKTHENYVVSVSATTRAPGKGEVDGVHYFFLTQDKFDHMVSENEFLEYASYVNHSYGTPRSFVEEQLNQGKDVLLEIDIQGGRQVRKIYPDTPLIFITPPSIDELVRRLTSRGRDSAESIARRLQRAAKEAEEIEEYDYVLVNDEIEACTERLHAVIQAEKARVNRRQDLIAEIQKQAALLCNPS
ncbi:MAG: guanylate kinase [Blautia sp.]|nr:guanylate kinase [Blautia sp.]